MSLKTKERENWTRGTGNGTLSALILTVGSRLLASFFETEGSSGYIDENKKRENWIRGTGH